LAETTFDARLCTERVTVLEVWDLPSAEITQSRPPSRPFSWVGGRELDLLAELSPPWPTLARLGPPTFCPQYEGCRKPSPSNTEEVVWLAWHSYFCPIPWHCRSFRDARDSAAEIPCQLATCQGGGLGACDCKLCPIKGGHSPWSLENSGRRDELDGTRMRVVQFFYQQCPHLQAPGAVGQSLVC
jgi:hypothetical protein